MIPLSSAPLAIPATVPISFFKSSASVLFKTLNTRSSAGLNSSPRFGFSRPKRSLPA